MVDAFAQYSHYHDHIWPIWDALVSRGTFYVSPIAQRPGVVTRALGPGPPLIVAGFGDIRRTRHREHIFVEHGAGETWGRIDPHYAGGPGRSTVALFLNPNRRVHEANQERYPKARHVLSGSARLESLRQVTAHKRGDHLRVVVSFHWDNRTFDATRSALNHYVPHFGGWAADSRIEVRGHAHPRIFEKAEKYFGRAGIQMIRSFEEVLAWADVYACDNSSTIFEAYACGIPVVLLDAPWHPSGDGSWRFDRFADIGPHSTGEDLVERSIQAFDTPVLYDEAVAEIFGAVDGAAVRAANAIEALYDSRTPSLPSSPPQRSDNPQPSLFGIV